MVRFTVWVQGSGFRVQGLVSDEDLGFGAWG